MSTKYQERRSKSENQLKEDAFNDQFQDDRAQLEADIRATERALRSAERNVETALSASPFNGPNILRLEDERDALKGGLTRLKTMLTEEFEEKLSLAK